MRSQKGNVIVNLLGVIAVITVLVIGYLYLLRGSLKPVPPLSPPSNLDTEEKCMKAGGSWEKRGLAQILSCAVPAVDAGKKCRDGSECSYEACISHGMKVSLPGLAEGVCAKFKPEFGCYSNIENGNSGQNICRD